MKKIFNLFRKNTSTLPITVVSGLPRSGTSMMMNMLEQGGIPLLVDGIRGSDKDNPNGYFEFEPVKKLADNDSAWLVQAQGKAIKIISSLLVKLPRGFTYRTIFLLRDIPEILASQKQMLIRRGKPLDKTSDQELSSLFENHLKQTFAWIKKQQTMECVTVNYTNLIKNPAPGIDKINRLFDNRLDKKKMAEVIDPSLYRQKTE